MTSAKKRSRAHTIYKNSEGKRLPGVTTIVGILDKPALVKWANGLGLKGIDSTKYVDILAGVGTLTHAMIHEDLGGDKVNLDEYSKDDISLAENAYLKYLEWKDRHNVYTVATEVQVISEKYQYGGTADLVARIDGSGMTLIDIKTSSGIWPEHHSQVAGYGIALKEMGYDIKEYKILRIGRTEQEGYDYKDVPYADLHERRFLLCREIYEINKQIRRTI